jgi:hypothetical protein
MVLVPRSLQRRWGTVKYENIYLRGYETAVELERGLKSQDQFSDRRRRDALPHSRLILTDVR